jgi:hypothetical protein
VICRILRFSVSTRDEYKNRLYLFFLDDTNGQHKGFGIGVSRNTHLKPSYWVDKMHFAGNGNISGKGFFGGIIYQNVSA